MHLLGAEIKMIKIKKIK